MSKLFITDLDGTLLSSKREVAPETESSIKELSDRNIVRVLATGRSLYSVRQVLSADFPLDYIIFSSGAGILECKSDKILYSVDFPATEVKELVEYLQNRHSFMLHEPIPENHCFFYHLTEEASSDFQTRLSRNKEFAKPMPEVWPESKKACQALTVIPGEDAERVYSEMQRDLSHLSVIRATSPLDGQSAWIELFPSSVSKGQAASWLSAKLGILPSETLVVGNDYNDLDLLRWGGTAYVVNNAPSSLREEFQTVVSNDQQGVRQAIMLWLESSTAK